MHDQFWSFEARSGNDWYEPEPARVIFLGAFFIKLGEMHFGLDWSGAIKKPSAEQAEFLMKEIAQAAAGKTIETLVLNPKTREFLPIAEAGWREAKSLPAKFSRCRIDSTDSLNDSAEGRHHGRIFVERSGAMSYLEAVRTSMAASHGDISLKHVSTYVRFLIHVAQAEELDEDEPLSRKEVEKRIAARWKKWRVDVGPSGSRFAAIPLTDTMIRNMATLLRGERAHSLRLGANHTK